MIGIVLTGHGNFASGLNSALELIAGKQENFQVVEFKENDSTDDLEINLKKAVEKLKKCNGIAFLTDLAGGSPFKNSVMLSLSMKDIDSFVISGTNLGMLLEVALNRDSYDLIGLKQLSIDSGKNSIKVYGKKVETNRTCEGI